MLIYQYKIDIMAIIYLLKNVRWNSLTMTRIRFKDLNKEQKKFICNGCGGKGSWIPVPNFMFAASCDHHDFNYWLGCNEEHREKADEQFLQALLEDAGKSRYIYLFKFWAKVYYRAVRFRGHKFFHFSDKEKSLEDLYNEIQIKKQKEV